MRRGQQQAGGGAATLVILMGLVIILYILFLPPAEREAILGNVTPGDIDDPTIIDEELDILLEESPGRVEAERSDRQTHQLNSVALYADFEDALLASYSDVYVFSSKTDRKVFSREIELQDDLVITEPFLALDIESLRGRLQVLVDGEEVYNARPTTPGTIMTDRIESLGDGSTVTIRVSEPGFFQFFTPNEAQIDRVRLLGRVHNREYTSAEQTFSLSQDGTTGIESAYLRFYLDCPGSVGRVIVRVNNELLSSSAYRCGDPVLLDINPEILEQGTNTVTFTIPDGSAIIDAPIVSISYTEPLMPLYYFEVTEEQAEALEDDEKDAIIAMTFLRDSGLKDVNVVLNGRIVRVDTRDEMIRLDVTNYLEEGENYLQLNPRRTLEIVELELFLQASQ